MNDPNKVNSTIPKKPDHVFMYFGVICSGVLLVLFAWQLFSLDFEKDILFYFGIAVVAGFNLIINILIKTTRKSKRLFRIISILLIILWIMPFLAIDFLARLFHIPSVLFLITYLFFLVFFPLIFRAPTFMKQVKTRKLEK